MTDAPVRIQRKRTRDWRAPENTVSVCRPGKWGNMFVIQPNYRPGRMFSSQYICVPTAEDAKECYREFLNQNPEIMAQVSELRGKNRMCFCKLKDPCHADVLLELANS